MRIDRSDLADEPDDARMDRRGRPTPDDPNASKDQGEEVGGNGRPESSPVPWTQACGQNEPRLTALPSILPTDTTAMPCARTSAYACSDDATAATAAPPRPHPRSSA